MTATGCVRSPFDQRAAERRRRFAVRGAWCVGAPRRGARRMRDAHDALNVSDYAARRIVSRCHSIPARLPLRQYASTGFGSASTSAANASTSASPISSRRTGR